MERLTEKIEGGYALKIPENSELSDLELKFAVYDKLGVLEDAEECKTLLHLPCAIGDTVWCALEDTVRLYGGVYEATVGYIDWSSDAGFKITVHFVSDEQPVGSIKFLEFEFNEKVFFGDDAKEKAEEAFEKMEEEKRKVYIDCFTNDGERKK